MTAVLPDQLPDQLPHERPDERSADRGASPEVRLEGTDGPAGPPPLPGRSRLRTPAVLARAVSSARAVPHLGTYTGIALAALGVVLLAVAWGKVAGLTNVALQLPYVISAGFAGLALVACGLTVISVAARQAEGVERRRQIAELRDVLAELRALVAQSEEDVR